MDETINVQIIDMDLMIPEQVTKNADGSYTIFLNARFTQERLLQSYKHAMLHIKAGDFDRQLGKVQEIEQIAHAVLPSEQPPVSANVVDEKSAKCLAALKRKRQKAQKLLQEYERDMAFLGEYDADSAFARAEYQWLYGNDL